MRNQPIYRTVTTAVAIFLLASASFASPQQNLDSALRSAGVTVSGLKVFDVDGILIVRGTVSQHAERELVKDVAHRLGYQRIANLTQFVPAPSDQSLVLAAERALSLTRALDGCRFVVEAEKGIVSVKGTVRFELQKDLAKEVVLSIEGVKAVEARFTRV